VFILFYFNIFNFAAAVSFLGRIVVHEMRPIATDVAYRVVCVSVCWAYEWAVGPTKTGEPIEMPFGGLTYVGTEVLFTTVF